MCLNEMYSRVQVGKLLSDMFPFNPGEVAREIFQPHKNLFFSSLHITWNYNRTVHIPFVTFLPLS